jgi:acetate kinase
MFHNTGPPTIIKARYMPGACLNPGVYLHSFTNCKVDKSMVSLYSIRRGKSMYILTLNCGSSSVKYQLYDWDNRAVLAKGAVERVTVGGAFITHYSRGKGTTTFEHECPSHREAVDLIIKLLLDPEKGSIKDVQEIKVVGHRLVHGGEKFAKSVIVDAAAMRIFKGFSDLSPLHNPANILGIEAAQRLLPDVPHCVSLDTAWHQTMPEHAYIYALPYKWYKNYGIRRYGFHGTSFLYVAKRASVLLGKDPFQTNLISLHIGNGASANAVKDGISVDTSMGMTPLEGLVMGTRSGDHDPAIGCYIMRKEDLKPEEMDTILNKKSGVLGITEKYTDRRDVMEARSKGNARARLAIDMESYRIKKYIGAYYAALGKIDAIVFTAGVGEMNATIRQKSVEGLEELGIAIDPDKNTLSLCRNAETDISGKLSKVKIFVIPTDEELVMTEDAYALLQGTYDVHTNFCYSFQDPCYVNSEREEALLNDLDKNPELEMIIARPTH